MEAVVVEDYEYESADYDVADGSMLISARPLGNATATTQDNIEAPNVSLRLFFPETWLFALDTVKEDSDLSR